MSNTTENSTDAPQRLLGAIKWFNNKSGYGFITVNDGDMTGKDVFVHYKTIRVANSQYTYLVQGEYVEFSLDKSTTGNHEYQANDVTGIKGGKLMCETRNSRLFNPSEPRPSSSQPRYKLRREVRDDVAPTTDENGYTTVQRRRPTGGRGSGRGYGRGRGVPREQPQMSVEQPATA